jgi:GrpB-like predicted nucleotidyltransferase (UPF0157 family)/nitroreductase
MDAIQAMHERRSIRAYQSRQVPRELVEELLWAAVQAPIPPVSGNEPWRIVVLQGAELLERLGERARQYAFEHQPPGRPWEWTTRPGFKVFWGAPMLVLLCARATSPEAAFDCCRAGQNLVIAAHARGIGSCWVGAPMPWLSDAAVQRELGIPDGFVPSVAIVLGYPAEHPVGNPKPRPGIHWVPGEPTQEVPSGSTEAPIELVEYDAAWPQRFESERALLEQALRPWIAGPIEHIGSTAVPGLAAKPIIDIMVPVESLSHADALIEAAQRIGYAYFPYKPQEMHWFCKPSPAHRTHHLHVVVFGGRVWRERLALRDALREDEALAGEYARLKRELAVRHRLDREAYTQAKEPFIRAVVARRRV